MNLKIKLYVRNYSTNNINPRVFEIIDSIKDTDKFQIALTHKSSVKKKDIKKSYETLEFIGDSILQTYVSIIIHNIFPDYNEGQLSNLRSLLVNTNNLSKITLKIGLHNYLKINKIVDFNKKPLTKTNAKILADIYESFLTALYLIKGKKVLLEFITLTLFNEPKFKDDLKLLNPNLIPNLPMFNDKIDELKNNPDILKQIKEEFNNLESSITKQIKNIDQQIPSNISDILIKEEFNKLESSVINQMRDINFFLSKEFNNLNLSLDEVQSVNLLFLELVNTLKKKPLNKELIENIYSSGNLNYFNKENLISNELDNLIITNKNDINGYIQEGPSNVNNIIVSNLLNEINNKSIINKPNLNNNLDHLFNSEKELNVNDFTLNNMKKGAIFLFKFLFSLIMLSSLFFLDESILQIIKKLINDVIKVNIDNKVENISQILDDIQVKELVKIEEIEKYQVNDEEIKDETRTLYAISETNSYIKNQNEDTDSLFVNYIIFGILSALGISLIYFIGGQLSSIQERLSSVRVDDNTIEYLDRGINSDISLIEKIKEAIENGVNYLNDLSNREAFPIMYTHLLAAIAYLWDDLEEPLNSSNVSEPLFISENENIEPFNPNIELINNEDLLEKNYQTIFITEEIVEEYEQIEQFTQTEPILENISNNLVEEQIENIEPSNNVFEEFVSDFKKAISTEFSNKEISIQTDPILDNNSNSNTQEAIDNLQDVIRNQQSIINNQNFFIDQAESSIIELNNGLNEAKDSITQRDTIILNQGSLLDNQGSLIDEQCETIRSLEDKNIKLKSKKDILEIKYLDSQNKRDKLKNVHDQLQDNVNKFLNNVDKPRDLNESFILNEGVLDNVKEFLSLKLDSINDKKMFDEKVELLNEFVKERKANKEYRSSVDTFNKSFEDYYERKRTFGKLNLPIIDDID